jgi:hypothetical protein
MKYNGNPKKVKKSLEPNPQHGALLQDTSATAHVINLRVVSINCTYL